MCKLTSLTAVLADSKVANACSLLISGLCSCVCCACSMRGFFLSNQDVRTLVLQGAVTQVESGDKLSDFLAEALQPVQFRATTGTWWYLLEGLLFIMTAGKVCVCREHLCVRHVTYNSKLWPTSYPSTLRVAPDARRRQASLTEASDWWKANTEACLSQERLLHEQLAEIMAAAVHEGWISVAEGLCDVIDFLACASCEQPNLCASAADRVQLPRLIAEKYMDSSMAGMSSWSVAFSLPPILTH